MSALLRDNWFWPIALFLVALAWMLSSSVAVSLTPSFERVLLFDVLITLPILFFLCYRVSLSKTALLIRILALQCAGIWVATKLIPVGGQTILPHLTWVRWAGLAMITLFEVRLVVAVVKLQWKPTTKQDELEAAGMPPLLAKLALLEARFWRWILRRPGT